MARQKQGDLRGHLWIAGKTEEDSLKETERALGREWFAITAFPLFVGTFGPIASALNICALVQPWRCHLAPNGVNAGDNIADPVWLVTVNALSLVLGVLANLSILLAVRDGSGWLAKYDLQLTIATVVGGLTASVILIALVITASAELDLPSTPSLSFTEAFYYAIISAVLYFITSSFIIYTAYMLWKLSKYERSEVQFAKGYRRLMLLTVLFMAYILLGAIVFSHIEGWNYLDAVYWADVTILTIGFGNFQPSTNLGRALLLPYAACGIFILFLIIYCIPKLVFDRGGSMWEIHLRDQERIRKVQEREEQERAQNATFQSHLPNGNAPKEDKKPAQDMDAAQATGALDEAKEKHREARKRDFMLMQDILKRTTRKRLLYSIILWASWLIILWLVGAACFYSFERAFGWTYFDAIYFTFTAILAIGYGDITLSSDSGKAFFVIWSLIVVPTLTMSIIAMVEAVGHPYVVSRKIRLKEMSGKISSSEEKRSITGIEGNRLEEKLPHNSYDKNHLLVKVLKRVILDHIGQQQDKGRPNYSFEDWEYIFYLLGALEPSLPEEENLSALDGVQSLAPKSSLEKRGARKRMIDWLHCKNPLNATETLTEWILLTLVEKLEWELLVLRRKTGNTSTD